jgi:predicted metal-binding transcription factor (methanogenesis marker protein 9)
MTSLEVSAMKVNPLDIINHLIIALKALAVDPDQYPWIKESFAKEWLKLGLCVQAAIDSGIQGFSHADVKENVVTFGKMHDSAEWTTELENSLTEYIERVVRILGSHTVIAQSHSDVNTASALAAAAFEQAEVTTAINDQLRSIAEEQQALILRQLVIIRNLLAEE